MSFFGPPLQIGRLRPGAGANVPEVPEQVRGPSRTGTRPCTPPPPHPAWGGWSLAALPGLQGEQAPAVPAPELGEVPRTGSLAGPRGSAHGDGRLEKGRIYVPEARGLGTEG